MIASAGSPVRLSPANVRRSYAYTTKKFSGGNRRKASDLGLIDSARTESTSGTPIANLDARPSPIDTFTPIAVGPLGTSVSISHEQAAPKNNRRDNAGSVASA